MCVYALLGRFIRVEAGTGVAEGINTMLTLAYKILAQQKKQTSSRTSGFCRRLRRISPGDREEP
jgi:hypothetical protein